MFEYLEHTADIKIRVKADSYFDFFSDIVKSVNHSIFENLDGDYLEKKDLSLEAKTQTLLIHDFIDEIVYLANYEFAKSKLVDIKLQKNQDKYILEAKLHLRKAKKEEYNTEVKAVSFNILYKENNKTKQKLCEFVLDI